MSASNPMHANEVVDARLADAVVDAARRQTVGDAAELFVQELVDRASSHESHAWASSTGCVRTVTARVWRGDRRALATLPLEGFETLSAVLAEAAEGEWTASRSPPPPRIADAREVIVSPLGSDEAVNQLASQAMKRALVQAFVVHRRSERSLLATSAGGRVQRLREHQSLLLRCETRQGAIVDGLDTAVTETLDFEGLEQRLGRAIETLDATVWQGPEAGLPWVLAPSVAAVLTLGLSWILRGDLAMKNPKLAASIGRRLVPAQVTVLDTPPPGATFDDEGQPVEPVTIFRRGVLESFLHTHETAQALGAEPRGRASRGPDGDPRPQPLRLHVAPGGASLPADRNELCARTEMFTLMPKPGRVTITAGGWVVRGHQRVAAIAPFELELPVFDVLRRVQAVGDDLQFFAALEGCGSPTLQVEPLADFAVR